jgi:hypothetical protein
MKELSMRNLFIRQRWRPSFAPIGALGIILAATIVAAILLLLAIDRVLGMPVVYKDYVTGECLRVESMEGKATCDNLPVVYETAWVEKARR